LNKQIAERLAICEQCDRLFAPTKTCKECGCFVVFKARFRRQECPLGKWSAIPVRNNNENNENYDT